MIPNFEVNTFMNSSESDIIIYSYLSIYCLSFFCAGSLTEQRLFNICTWITLGLKGKISCITNWFLIYFFSYFSVRSCFTF